jgi:murein DD-endopeptidase MepM/ murein hydrolase activator NlpD
MISSSIFARCGRSAPARLRPFKNRHVLSIAGLCAIALLSACNMKTQAPAQVVAYSGMAGDGAGSAGMHTVLEGDTVYTVSKQYNLPMRDIIEVNHLSAPYKLDFGYRIKLPAPNEYTVKKYDTLYTVAHMFDSSVNEVARLNNLSAPYTLTAGQTLRLPSPALKGGDFTIEEAPAATAMKIDPVEREVLGGTVSAPSVPAAGQPPQPQAQTNAPAQVQQASVAAPKIPDEVPPRVKGNGKFMMPVEGKIISPYGSKADGLHNDGINIKVPRGTPVRAADNGVVVYAGSEIQGYGNLVLVRHADRWMTAYAHMDKILVKKGDSLKQGQSLGTVGSTGTVDSPQLHFEVRRGTKAIDPQAYL